MILKKWYFNQKNLALFVIFSLIVCYYVEDCVQQSFDHVDKFRYDRLYRVKTFLDNTIKVRATSILQYTVLWRQSGIMLRSVLPISDF